MKKNEEKLARAHVPSDRGTRSLLCNNVAHSAFSIEEIGRCQQRLDPTVARIHRNHLLGQPIGQLLGRIAVSPTGEANQRHVSVEQKFRFRLAVSVRGNKISGTVAGVDSPGPSSVVESAAVQKKNNILQAGCSCVAGDSMCLSRIKKMDKVDKRFERRGITYAVNVFLREIHTRNSVNKDCKGGGSRTRPRRVYSGQ